MKMSFMAACVDFFGLKPGQSKVEFGREVKQLNEKDREEITEGLAAFGYEIEKTASIQTIKEVALA